MSRVIIWIRHGEKEYKNSKGPPGSYQHDPPLATNQEQIIIDKGKELIDAYGVPDKCLVSPYKRTRETAKLLLNNKTNVDIEIINSVSEYLGHHENDISNIEPLTVSHQPPLNENIQDVNRRCSSHLCKLGVHDNKIKPEIIWVITHGIIIKTIGKQLSRTHGKINLNDIRELDALVLIKKYTNTIILHHSNEINQLKYIDHDYDYDNYNEIELM